MTAIVIKPQIVGLTVNAYSGDTLLKSKKVFVEIDAPKFDVDYEYENGLLSLFFIIDNRNQPKRKNINIELNINQGRSTIIADYFGPYTLPENDVLLLAQEYKLGLKGEFELKARASNNAIASKQLRIE